jgi:hypothetical protein
VSAKKFKKCCVRPDRKEKENMINENVVNIPFTRKQYRTLLLMAYLGEWMMNAHKTDDRNREFDELEHYLMSFAKECGEENSVVHDKELKKYYPTKEFEEMAQEYDDDYDNETFWDELVNRLSERDAIEKYGKERIKEMSGAERIQSLGEREDYYSNEFQEHGLDRITLND